MFKDDKTHLAASTHGKDLRDVGVTAVLDAFSVVDVHNGLGVDKQRLALAFALARTHRQDEFYVAAEASSHARLLQNESGSKESSLSHSVCLPPLSSLSMYHCTRTRFTTSRRARSLTQSGIWKPDMGD